MIYRTYGSTGIQVSALGFGGMRFENQSDVDACAALVKAAHDSGITYFDTAIGYGKSEDLFGVAFKEMLKTRDQRPFYVSTKTFGGDPASVRGDCERSLERMGLESIDFYHMWCIKDLATYDRRKAGGALREFEKLKDEGLVKHIVVSSHMTGSDIGDLLRDYPFDGVLLGYSAMNFAYREKALEAAAELNRGVVVMNPLGGGLIPSHPDRFNFVRTRDDESVVDGALRFLFNDPRITVTLVGFANQQHLREALQAMEGFQPIPPDEIQRIRVGIHGAFNELCTSCGYCDECPRGIPIPHMMDAYNQFVLTGSRSALVNRLRMHWSVAPDSDLFDACIECGACEAACTQKLEICNRLRVIRDEVKAFLKEQSA